ncbi:MAG: ferrous iron transport protein A [Fischerella sp.]|nr:ferrous iron transport protein A [Fischerella sp.]
MNNNDRSQIRTWEGFTFICDTPTTALNENFDDSDAVFPLSQARQGDVVYIVSFPRLSNINYLSSIGLIPGREIQVKSRMKSGSVIIAWQDKCLGLGANIAACVMVKKDGADLPPC